MIANQMMIFKIDRSRITNSTKALRSTSSYDEII